MARYALVSPGVRIAICLVAGALLTLTLSIACALWTPVNADGRGPGIQETALAPPGLPPGIPLVRSGDLEYRTGWPWFALSGVSRFRGAPDGGVDAPRFLRPRTNRFFLPKQNPSSGKRIIPLTPMWPGFLADTALFAGLFGLPWFVGSTRRAWRRRRGVCVRCGYERRGAERCPECGTTP